jgi:subtilisin family serine protease
MAKRKKRSKAKPKPKPKRKKAAPSPSRKLDPVLSFGLSAKMPSALPELAKKKRPPGEEVVSVLIDCAAAETVRKRLDGWGGSSSPISSSTLVALLPRKKLEALAKLSSVRYVEASTRLRLHSDRAHLSTGLVRSGSRTVPQTGRGVLVGVVDTGIDVAHPAFRSGGKTRIVDYLDQFRDVRFTAADIDSGAAAGSTDVIGHGTHVAGIAAGNGAGSPGSSLRGVAPDADLAVVKSTLETADILAALAHVFDVARERGQPAVVNCSFGGHVGGHDGSTILERAIDELSGPGRIVVVSAGNEGNDPIHAHAVLRGDGSTPARWEPRFALNRRTVQGGSGPVELGVLLLQVWQQREDALRVRLRSPTGVLLDAPLEGMKEHDSGSYLVRAQRQVHPYSGDPFVTFEVLALPQSQWLSGWTLVVEEEAAGSAKVGPVHAWIADVGQGSFVTGATFAYQIGMPATAYSAVTVGSFVTRNEWSSRDPANRNVVLDDLELESLSAFASRGPTRDGDTKPEIAAPGEWLLAPLSKDAPVSELPLFTRAAGMEYAALRGTSMSAPYVTGSLALLLEKDGSIDWAEAKRRIIKSTRQDGFTQVSWNPAWGHGKLDVQRLLQIEPD